jgi:hypothetical protein
MQTNNDGTFDIGDDNGGRDLDRRRLKQVGTIQLLRGNRFIISLDEHRLPEGTRALYVKEYV